MGWRVFTGCLFVLFLSTAIRADLVSHFSFDGDLLDPVSGNDGTFVGADAATFVEGYDGTADGAVSFDGVDDFVNVAQTAGLPLTDEPSFTVAMWVKAASQNDKRVFSEGSDSDNSPLYNIGSDNTGNTGALDIFIRRDSGNGTAVGHFKTARDAFDDSWHHIAVVDDDGAITLYIDGVRDGAGVSYTREPLTTNNTTIGGILRGSSCCLLTGVIDEVRLYNHALTAEEVEGLVPEPGDCPAEGDTTCGSLDVAGPDGGGPGLHTLTAADVVDGSGDDPLYYTFSGESDAGDSFHVGPQTSNETTVNLGAGNWTLTATVDDNILCRDTAGSCTAELSLVSDPPRLVSHWPLDGTLEDIESGNNGAFTAEGSFGTGYDCTSSGAARFTGADNLIRAETNDGLPIYNSSAYSVAMWVNGPAAQRDMRVYSESNTQGNNSPLLNIGTDSSNPPTGLVDIFIREDGGNQSAPHKKSVGVAFDDTWHHITWVDDNGNAVLYIDGVQDPADFTYTKGTLTIDTTTIGGILRASPSHFFTGSIDDVKVFNYALSAEEAAELGSGPLPDCGLPQVQGDCNQDGVVDVADVICSIGITFPGFDLLSRDPTPLPCDGDATSDGNLAVLDLNADGAANFLDGVYIANYLFNGGAAPPQGDGCFGVVEAAGCGRKSYSFCLRFAQKNKFYRRNNTVTESKFFNRDRD